MKQKIKLLIQSFIESTTNIATLNSRTLFVRENLKDIIELTNFLPENSKVNERLYLIYNEIFTLEELKCPMCENKRKFYTFTSGHNICCSISCTTKYQQKYLISKEQKENIYKKRTENNSKKSEEVLQAEVNKRITTTKERYGENAFSEISKKGHKTKIKNGTYIAPWTILKNNKPLLWKDMHFRAAETMKNNIDVNGNNHYDRIHLQKLDNIDDEGNNFYNRLHINNLKNIDVNGNNVYDRRTLQNYESGFWTKPEDKSDLEHYRIKVAKVMYKFKNEISKLENFDLRGHANQGKYHLDHKFSTIEGFKNNIPVHIIGHVCNLEMILGRNNLSKNRKCSIDLETLIDNINNYNTGKCIN